MTLDPKTQGLFSWNELMTTDLEGAKRFHGALFGWAYEQETIAGGPMAGTPYVTARVKGDCAAGLMNKPADPHIPSCWGAYVTVDDLDAALAKAGELGGGVVEPPMPVKDYGRIAFIRDPQGAVLGLWEFAKQGTLKSG